MKYKLSEKYIRNRKQGGILFAIAFSLIGLLLVVIGTFTENYAMYMGVVFFLFSWQTIPSIRYWSKYGSKIYLEVSSGEIIQGNTYQQSRQSLSVLTRMTVQRKGDLVKSILLKFESGGFHKFEGFENMDQLAREIEASVDAGKVRVAKWFHR